MPGKETRKEIYIHIYIFLNNFSVLLSVLVLVHVLVSRCAAAFTQEAAQFPFLLGLFSYLSDRRISIEVNGHLSSCYRSNTEVPQDSVLVTSFFL